MTSRPAADRRIVERRRQVAADRVRRRRRQLALGVAAVLLAAGVARLASSPLFSLTSVRVAGTAALTPAEVLAASRVRPGMPYLALDPGVIRRRVETLPRVARAEVHRVYPSSLRIAVVERPATAAIAAGGRWWQVAADGTVLEAASSRPAGLPFVAHVPVPAGLRPGTKLPANGPLANALSALGGLSPQLARQVTGVEARSVDSLAFRLRDRSTVLYGLAEAQPAKDAAALLLLGKLARQGRKVVLVDVRNPSAPTVSQGKKPATGG
ncbi:MAG TPA: FtsQ-type POTRA domain-containing protein [Actinomycetota bacterium]|nr:FtsQ-type POTRA domain-containing protein [Actinomycetota bacterium]